MKFTPPANAPTTDLLTTLAESYLERLRRGENPSMDEYAGQHPQLASEIRELFNTLRLVDELGEKSQFGGTLTTAVDPIPTRLGDFQLIREIARGGMGIVYDAVQTQLGRRVAVKVLPPAHGSDTSRRIRFRHEARAAANLHHSNIVPVFDVGEEQGISYYSMQYIEGETLAEVWRELRQMQSPSLSLGSTYRHGGEPTLATSISASLLGNAAPSDIGADNQATVATEVEALSSSSSQAARHRSHDATLSNPTSTSTSLLDPRMSGMDRSHHSNSAHRRYFDNIATIMLQVVDALEYAHSCGVLHRDIKPSNVILDTHCRAWLTDFGLAKVGGGDLTAEGNLVGTLRYMSPERFSGKTDARSDVYSAGLMLYEFATLRPAFDARDHAGMMHLIQNVNPTAPRECDPDIPKDLESIIRCATEKEPARRYPTAAALATDLRCYLEGRPLLVHRASWWEHSWRWCNRNPVVSILTAVLAGVILSAWMATYLLWRHAASAQIEAQKNLVSANRNLDLAVSAVNQFCSKVSEDLRMKQQDLRPLRKELLSTAVDFHEQLLELRDRSQVAHVDLARAYRNLATLTAEIEAPQRAMESYRQAIAEYDALLKRQPNDATIEHELSVSLTELAHLFVYDGQSGEANELFARAVGILAENVEAEPKQTKTRSQLAEVLSLQAYTMTMTQQFESSKALFRQAIKHYETLRSQLPEETKVASQLAHTHLKLAEALVLQSITNWRDAEAELKTALDIQRVAVAEPNAKDFEWRVLGSILRQLGNVEKMSGRLDESIRDLKESIDVFERLMQEQPTVLAYAADAASSYVELGTCQNQADNPQAAESGFQRSADIWERLVNAAPGNTIWESHFSKSLYSLGNLCRNRGDLPSALRNLQKAISLLDEILVREPNSLNAHRFLSIALCDRGKIRRDMENYDDAIADFTRALEVDTDASSDSVRLERAYALALSGDYSAAVTEAQDSLDEMMANCDVQFLSASFLIGARVYGRAAAAAKIADDESQLVELSQLAIEMLQHATEAGLEFTLDIQQSPDFEILRDDADFARLNTSSVGP